MFPLLKASPLALFPETPAQCMNRPSVPLYIISLPAAPFLPRLDLLLLRLHAPLILLSSIPILSIRHLLVTPAPATHMIGVIFFRYIALGIGLEVLVYGFIVFICGATVCAGGDDFFF